MLLAKVEQLLQGSFVELRADHAEAAGHSGLTAAQVDLAGDIVEIQPLTVGGIDNALCAQDSAEAGLVLELFENAAQLVLRELLGRFHAPALEDLVGVVVMMVMVLVVIVMVMVALALRIVAFLAVMVMMVVMLMLVVIVVVVVMVALALRIVAFLTVVVMMVMVLVLVVIVVVVVMVALALRIVALVLVMVMVMVVLMLHLFQLMPEAVFIHGLKDLRAGELIPGGGDETGLRVQGLEDFGGLKDLFGLDGAGAAHDDEVGVGNLIVEKFAEIAGVHFGLARVHDGDLRADVRALHALHRGGDIGQLADARRLENSSMTFLRALVKSPTRVQQMQPEFISVIWTPASCRKPPSMAISPNSFSMRTSFSFL